MPQLHSHSYYITTLGCPKNEADSRAMEESLLREGFRPASRPEVAELHLINTCAFIESARVETIETTLTALAVREKKQPAQKVILAGCFAERYKENIASDLPEIDFAFGTGQYHRAGQLIGERFGRPQGAIIPYARPHRPGQVHAYVKVADGCNRACHFCAIPRFRGPFQADSRENILREVEQLKEQGVREIALVSQDTNNWSNPEDFLDLLEAIRLTYPEGWLRLLYMYPDRRTYRIFEGIARRGIDIVPYLESPLQHTAPHVLKAMNRQGDASFYGELFHMARELFPGLEIRTAFIIGYEGETRSDVDHLIDFMTAHQLEKVSCFAFSPEENTKAELYSAHPETAERIRRILDAHRSIQKECMARKIGEEVTCLVDSVENGTVLLRRPQDAPEMDGVVLLTEERPVQPGDFLRVQLTDFHEYDFSGRPA